MIKEKRGKNINLYLIDGEVTGRIKCTVANWTGIACKLPRTDLEESKNIEYLNYCGVYFLFGVSEETGKGVVYIGQANSRKNGDGLLNRLLEHKRNEEKDYWTEGIILTTTGNTLGFTEISYLENRFCKLAMDANRYEVKNGNEPTLGNITEEKQSEMEEFLDLAKIVIGVLGHKVLEPYTRKNPLTDDENEEPLLSMTYGEGRAKGRQTKEGFVVLKGSKINSKTTNSCPKSAIKRRDESADFIDENFILREDILFNSPSGAAGFVGGGSINGNAVWKDKNGCSLGELEGK